MTSSRSTRIPAWLIFVSGAVAGAAVVLLVLLAERLSVSEPTSEYGEALAMICGRIHDNAEKVSSTLSQPGAEQEFDRIFYSGYTRMTAQLVDLYGKDEIVQFCGGRITLSEPGLSFAETKQHVQEILATVQPYTGGNYPSLPWLKR